MEGNGLGPPSLVYVWHGEDGYYWQVVDRYNRVIEESEKRFNSCYRALGDANPHVRRLRYVMELGPVYPEAASKKRPKRKR